MSESFKIGELHVHTIESASGLFIGQTMANGWNSKSKTNQAFGELSQTQAKELIGIVQDNDEMDMMNVDRTVSLTNKSGFNNFKDVEIKVNGVHLNAMDTNAAISIGENQQNGWQTRGKNNFGTGRMIGKNGLKQFVNTIDDRDGFDFYSLSKNLMQTNK